MIKRLFLIFFVTSPMAHGNEPKDTPEDTELWDPVPVSVSPGESYGSPPSDAVILFDGKNLDNWVSHDRKGPAAWKVAQGVVTVVKGAGDIFTKQVFDDFQLHLEWRVPSKITGSGQARGNSGVFLAVSQTDGYELQILDCYNNRTYVNGQAAAVYKQSPPLVNACKKPGEWQSYDIIWTAPRFYEDGSLKSPARITALHNGVLVQNNFELKGVTKYIGDPVYKKHGPSPIMLQAHQDPSEPLSFRNIWLRRL